jgi:hypothetical protein
MGGYFLCFKDAILWTCKHSSTVLHPQKWVKNALACHFPAASAGAGTDPKSKIFNLKFICSSFDIEDQFPASTIPA